MRLAANANWSKSDARSCVASSANTLLDGLQGSLRRGAAARHRKGTPLPFLLVAQFSIRRREPALDHAIDQARRQLGRTAIQRGSRLHRKDKQGATHQRNRDDYRDLFALVNSSDEVALLLKQAAVENFVQLANRLGEFAILLHGARNLPGPVVHGEARR
jgi:hypothetical protein